MSVLQKSRRWSPANEQAPATTTSSSLRRSKTRPPLPTRQSDAPTASMPSTRSSSARQSKKQKTGADGADRKGKQEQPPRRRQLQLRSATGAPKGNKVSKSASSASSVNSSNDEEEDSNSDRNSDSGSSSEEEKEESRPAAALSQRTRSAKRAASQLTGASSSDNVSKQPHKRQCLPDPPGRALRSASVRQRKSTDKDVVDDQAELDLETSEDEDEDESEKSDEDEDEVVAPRIEKIFACRWRRPTACCNKSDGNNDSVAQSSVPTQGDGETPDHTQPTSVKDVVMEAATPTAVVVLDSTSTTSSPSAPTDAAGTSQSCSKLPRSVTANNLSNSEIEIVDEKKDNSAGAAVPGVSPPSQSMEYLVKFEGLCYRNLKWQTRAELNSQQNNGTADARIQYFHRRMTNGSLDVELPLTRTWNEWQRCLCTWACFDAFL